jgi:uncharacterized protein (TIGR02145 family)
MEATVKTVKIGNQVWIVENLNVSTFRNGDPIKEAKTWREWDRAGEKRTPVWCYYKNDSENDKKYGKLYNWFAVNDPRGLAPEGFHIPSKDEFEILLKIFQSDDKNTKAYNALIKVGSSGFNSLFGGQCNYGDSALAGVCACYWSTTPEERKDDISLVWALIFDSRDPCAIMFSQEPGKGLSVRCLMD